MRFRPCIDLHGGRVKQIVGRTLRDGQEPVTHFTAGHPPAYFAGLYRRDGLGGGHLIMLGPGNEAAAAEALSAFPGGLQVGGGITADNAPRWLERGARQVVITSYVFRDGLLHAQNLEQILRAAGRENLVLDLSCGRRQDRYYVMTNRWQQYTDFEICRENLELLAASCSEFLIHATDVEGQQQGIDAELVGLLGEIAPIPTTYAGGVRSRADIDTIEKLGRGRLDFTVGSALDLFGGQGLRYADMVAYNRSPPTANAPMSGRG